MAAFNEAAFDKVNAFDENAFSMGLSLTWTEQSDDTTIWSVQAGASTTWSVQADESTTWTET